MFSVDEFKKEWKVFDEPNYLGLTILELRKLLKYEFIYNKFQSY